MYLILYVLNTTMLVGEFVMETVGQNVVALVNMGYGRVAVTPAQKVRVLVSFLSVT